MKATFAKVPKMLSVSAFRAALAKNLAKAKKRPVMIADNRGGGNYVILSAEVYNKLLEAWEDEQDSRELVRLVEENKGKKFIPWEQVR